MVQWGQYNLINLFLMFDTIALCICPLSHEVFHQSESRSLTYLIDIIIEGTIGACF